MDKNHPGKGNAEKRKEYIEHRKEMLAAVHKYALFFDRTFIYIVIAVFAFSLHFVYNNNMPVNPLTLIFWGLMVLAIIFFIFGYKFVSLAYDKEVKIVDESYVKDRDPWEIRNPFNTWEMVFDWAAVICFCSGFILMFIYLCAIYFDC